MSDGVEMQEQVAAIKSGLDELTKKLVTPPAPPRERLWSIQDIADYACCSKDKVTRLRQKGDFPYPVMRILRWRPQDVIAYFESVN